ncbi:MAG: exo-alpha-sialidase [Mangrovibacterium sp.]
MKNRYISSNLQNKFCFLFILMLFVFRVSACKTESDNVSASGTTILDIQVKSFVKPILIQRQENQAYTIHLNMKGEDPVKAKQVKLSFSDETQIGNISEIRLYYAGSGDKHEFFGKVTNPGNESIVSGEKILNEGLNIFRVSVVAKPDSKLTDILQLVRVEVNYSDSASGSANVSLPSLRYAHVLRAAGQDHCHTYRIPGLITTREGTLIAVYDNRYNNSKDLQEDIDIGMSRSTDGGQTWEPMKVIMDMGEWGGRPQQLNGTGDPCVLYDHITNTIWVAALWMSGSSPDQMVWRASKPGLEPEETGQFMLVKSSDDGISWSQPVNITRQIKDPAWQLLLQGPGRGLCMTNGTLVFPAQFKKNTGSQALDGGSYTCHSTIVYSEDGGLSWKIGTGAKPNTTEAQVVELTDGSLMLNMRDDLNRKDKSATNGRAVSITADMGKTWTVHPGSNSALPEPNCMASLISADIPVNGIRRQILFFSNPNNKTERKNMTIKASLDNGMTWPAEYQVELNEEAGYGYSCMTMIDEKSVGILYEGERELYFQIIPVKDIIK